MEMTDIIFPILITVIPALLTYSQVPTQAGMVCGFVIGVVIGVGAEILPIWTLTLAVLAVSSTIYVNLKK